MSDKKEKNKKNEWEETLLDEFPEDLLETEHIPNYDPMTIDIWDLVNAQGVMPKVMAGIKDPQLREDMMDYTRGMCLVYQKSLEKAREHLKDPDTFKKVIETLQKNRHKK